MNIERSSGVDFLQAQLEVANGLNARLSEENALLRHKLERFTNDQHSNSTMHIEAKLKALKFEDERDRLYEKLEKTKRKYNQLHDAYLQKVKRCKAYEDVFNRQKTLNGLVRKSSVDQSENEQDVAPQNPRSENMESLEEKVNKLQTALDKAYDRIDELEFDLESVDFLEMETQRLQNELEACKKEKLKLRKAINRTHPVQHIQQEETNEDQDGPEEDGVEEKEEEVNIETEDDPDELPGYQESNRTFRYDIESNASSLADSIIGDMDPETMERAVLTESLNKTVKLESSCLRRQLFGSRLRNTRQPAVRPTSSDA